MTACASPPQVIEAPRIVIPASLLTCADQPAPPDIGADDTALVYWLQDKDDAGQECRDKLARVRGVVGAPVR